MSNEVRKRNAEELQKDWERFLRTQNEKEKTETKNQKAEEKD